MATNSTCISLPEGASQHGNNNLICVPPQWYDFAIFYLSNYVAHAATLHSFPGQKWDETLWRAISALFLPITGIRGGVEFLQQAYKIKGTDPVQRAAACRALCTIRRKVAPRRNAQGDVEASVHCGTSERNQTVSLELQGVYGVRDESLADAPEPRVSMPREEDRSWVRYLETTPMQGRNIQGVCILPDDFEFAILKRDAPLRVVAGISSSMDRPEVVPLTSRPELPLTYNFPKALVSLIQAFWAASTLYRARGDQIDKYGYAAFGLTVAPYTVMSVINLLANLFVPEYPCLFLVSSPDMVVAQQPNHGGIFQPVLADMDVDADSIDKRGISMLHMLCALMVVLIATGAIFSPLIIMGAMSHFQPNGSTPMQRGWTITWMIVGIIIPSLLDTDSRNMTTQRAGFDTMLHLVLVPGYAPAIGGMVIVGQMLHEFGMCTQLV